MEPSPIQLQFVDDHCMEENVGKIILNEQGKEKAEI